MKPVGTPIREADVAAARYEGESVGSPIWGVTNALRLQGAHGKQSFDLDLRAVARNEELFEQLVQLAAAPLDFARNGGPEQDEAGE